MRGSTIDSDREERGPRGGGEEPGPDAGSATPSPHVPISSSRSARGARGFTLIELMVVIAIIGILVSMGVPTYRNIIQRARETVLRQNLAVLRDVIDQYYADKGKYPDSLETLVTEGYLRNMPVDPMTEQSNWTTVQYTGGVDGQLEPTEGESGGGIWDVHSASDGVGHDGRKYSEW